MEYLKLAILLCVPAVLMRAVRKTDAAAEYAEGVLAEPDGAEAKYTRAASHLSLIWMAILASMMSWRTGDTDELGFNFINLAHDEILMGVWALLLGEYVYCAIYCRGTWGFRRYALGFLGALLPPLRLLRGAGPNQVYVPFLGWRAAGKASCNELSRAFGGPMMAVALLILPILAAELVWLDSIAPGSIPDFLTDVGTQGIWLAFAIEFFVLVSVAPKKLAYCARHWLDIAIIVLPLISFFRCLRLLRLGRIARVQKMTRVYRLRGATTRVMRTMVLLKLVDHMGGWAARKRLNLLKNKVKAKQEEIEELMFEIRELENALAVEDKPQAVEACAEKAD